MRRISKTSLILENRAHFIKYAEFLFKILWYKKVLHLCGKYFKA